MSKKTKKNTNLFYLSCYLTYPKHNTYYIKVATQEKNTFVSDAS